jgi:ATP-dependent helicase/nuclease subunit A
LVQHDGRRRLVARLGDEAEDGIDELLNQTLAYERADVPSLTGFLIWLDAESIDIKRQAEASGQRIRVMTVHGAKGLESEIVILPDTADRKPQDRDEIYLDAEGRALWKVPASESPPQIATLRADKQRREAEENLRLLYVAMTRARTWLIIAAAGSVTKPVSWYAIAAEGMNRVGAEARYETGDWPEPLGRQATAVATDPAPAPWASFAVPQVAPVPDLVTPSDLGGAKALPGEVTADGTTRGDAVHRLLQHLPGRPAQDWVDLAAHLVPDPDLCASVWPEVQAVLTAPALAFVFAADTLAEVGVTAALGDRRLYGVIDRLVIGPDRVLAVDFKSNAVVPQDAGAVPEGVLRQLGAYRDALTQIYPNRGIETAIVWTRTAQLMPVGADIVTAALARAMREAVMRP